MQLLHDSSHSAHVAVSVEQYRLSYAGRRGDERIRQRQPCRCGDAQPVAFMGHFLIHWNHLIHRLHVVGYQRLSFSRRGAQITKSPGQFGQAHTADQQRVLFTLDFHHRFRRQRALRRGVESQATA